MWSRRRVMAMLVAAAGAAGTTQLRAFANASGQVEQDGAWLSQYRTPDGRLLEYFAVGPDDGLPLVCHHGTPSSAAAFALWEDAAAAAGMRVIAYSRPGYGRSTRLVGRDVAQAANDTSLLLDHLGADAFVTIGWSGGGPHALACGAQLANRCKGVATLAGVGAWGESDLDFLAGMGPENVGEFGAAVEGEEALVAFLAEHYTGLSMVTGEEIAESFGGLVSEPDKAALTDAFANNLATSIRWSLHSGFDGWIDDDLAFVQSWGFRLDSMRVPVTVWQGQQDYMVPGSHGKWLVKHIPSAKLKLEPGQGHFSLVTTYLPTILENLAAYAD